jgi:hypothetical protein
LSSINGDRVLLINARLGVYYLETNKHGGDCLFY